MAAYLLKDLLDRLSEIASDGYRVVEISELEAEDDLAACLDLTAKSDQSDEDYGQIDALSDDEEQPRTVVTTFDDLCHELNFSYREIAVLHHAVSNALEFYKEKLKDKSIPRDVKEEIKGAEIATRNLQAKLTKVVKRLPRK